MKKEIFKKLLPGYILAFVTSFMFFIYEPIFMYSTNIEEFWFDLYKILGTNIFLFLISCIILIFIYTIIFFIDKKITKKNIILNIFTIIWFGLFLDLYIQGNYLIGDLPTLTGAEIVWNKYITQNIISIVLFILVFLILFILIRKFKFEKIINLTKYISLGVFGMLFVSLISILLTTEGVLKSKKAVYTTTENYGIYSKDENFIIFIVDTADSIEFNKIVESNQEYSNLFKDFTYYPDTLSAYPYTVNSIPYILTGVWNENETSYEDYCNKAYNESALLNTLIEKDFDINIYTEFLTWTDEKVNNVNNAHFVENGINRKKLISEEIKYILFKYLPYPVKSVSNIEEMNFNSCRITNQKQKTYLFGNKPSYDLIKYTNFSKVDKKQFKFIHIEGPHLPYNLDKDLNKIKNGTYEQKIEASLTIINSYIQKLKDNNLYDNSNIIIMADHGCSPNDNPIGRQNPILYIKGINETHEEMYESDLPISFTDLSDAFLDLINGKNSEELFSNVEKDRTRRFLFHHAPEYILEYIQTGKAWDEETLIKTGKEFKR